MLAGLFVPALPLREKVNRIWEKGLSTLATAETSLQKLPPQNLDAERGVLGAILLDNEALPRALNIVKSEDFYSPAHRQIFSVICTLFERNEVIDLVTVTEELERQENLGHVGGAAYLMALLEATPTAGNVHSHAKIVKEKSILRRLINVSTQIAAEGYEDKEDSDLLLDRAQQLIFSVAEDRVRPGFFAIKDLVRDSFKMVEELYEKKLPITGLATGFTRLDEMTSGLHNSDLIIIAARPSMGKTSFCLNIAQHVAIKQRVPVGIFSLETSKEQLVMRMLCSEAKVDSHKVRTGFLSEQDWPKLTTALGHLSEAAIFIDDTPGISSLELRAKARRLKSEHGLGLVMVDYLQLMRGRGRTENRQQEITEISASLKAVARELSVPVIALSQLSRAVESRKPPYPQLSDLRESGAIEQDADVVAFIYRPEMYKQGDDLPQEEEGIADIIIGKQRNGPTGVIKLAFLKQCTRFENLDANYEYQPMPEGGAEPWENAGA